MENVLQKQHGLTFGVIQLTPQLAQEYKDTMPKNQRKLRERHVRLLAHEIKSKRGWQLNGVPLIFNKKGELIDGNHRCTAVILSGMSILVTVVKGAQVDSIKTIDLRASGRRLGDYLSMQDKPYANGNLLAATCGCLHRYLKAKTGTTWSYNSDAPNTGELDDILRDHPEIENSITYSRLVDKVYPSNSDAACLHYLFSRIDSGLADRFFTKLGGGDGLSKKDPILVLREKLLENKAKKHERFSRVYIKAIAIKTWNNVRENKTPKRVHWQNQREPFPTII